MFWLFFLGGFVVFVALIAYSAKKREERLSGVPIGVRRRFEEREKFRFEQRKIKREAQELKDKIKGDAKLSVDVKNAIEVAQAEGRSYTRVWVLPSSIDSVKRWAGRHNIRIKSVKSGKQGDILVSLTGFKKNQRFDPS